MSLRRYADTDEQEEMLAQVEEWTKRIGIKLRIGTKVGKYPQTVILDWKYQDGVVRVDSDDEYGGIEAFGVENIEDFEDFRTAYEEYINR